MKSWKRRIATGVICCLALMAATGTPAAPPTDINQSSPSQADIGEALLRAAEARDWTRARLLLEQGADPNVTAFRPPHSAHPVPPQDWRYRYSLNRPSPLSQAAAQGNVGAVRMLLHYGAKVNIRALRDPAPLIAAIEARQPETARILIGAGADLNVLDFGLEPILRLVHFSGSHDLIRLIENAEKVPVYKRTVPQEPYAPGAVGARPRLVVGTVGAVPMRHLLWVSPKELLVLHDSPCCFVLVNVETGRQTDLPALSARWAAQEQFTPDFLAISPDGAWLVGDGGTSDKPTWLATAVRGDAFQEWPRVTPEDILNRRAFAWMDGRRWLELAGPYASLIARLRTLGNAAVQELPVTGSGMISQQGALFHFPTPANGRIEGEGGFAGGPSGGMNGEGYSVEWLDSLSHEPPGWRLTQREVVWKQADHPGFFPIAMLSPAGDKLAWLASFSESDDTALLVSDANGAHSQIVYEQFSTPEHAQVEAIFFKSLGWTPRADALTFWRGGKGENGLWLLPLSGIAPPFATIGKSQTTAGNKYGGP